MQHLNAFLILIFVFYIIWRCISDKINLKNIYWINENYLPLNQEEGKKIEFNEEFKEGLI
jgi:hypothetical protein